MASYTVGHEQMLEYLNVCSFTYVTFVSRIFAPKHLLIVLMSDSCTNFTQNVTLLL